jgi:hypothetical protein
MGQSEGSWLNNSIEGRAEDTYAAVEYLKSHPAIDANNIGLVGHSQGGWVVNLIASQHEEIAFFISLAEPTTSIEANMEDNYRGGYSCDGYQGEELEVKVANNLRLTRFGATIGKVIPFGGIGFDALIIDYDPYDVLQNVDMPGLFVYAENDILVSPEHNINRFNEVFDGSPPENLIISVIPDANHVFRVTDSMCTSWYEALEQPFSEDLVTVLENWLTSIGY